MGHDIEVHGTFESVFEDIGEITFLSIITVAAAHRIDFLSVFRDIGPVVIQCPFTAWCGGGDGVAADEFVEAILVGAISHEDLETGRRGVDIDIPVANTAVDFDFAVNVLGAFRRSVVFEFQESQDRFYRVPMIGEGGFGAFDGLAADIPMGVDPIWIANHKDDSVFPFDDGGDWGNGCEGAFRWGLSEVFALFFFSVCRSDLLDDFRISVCFWGGRKFWSGGRSGRGGGFDGRFSRWGCLRSGESFGGGWLFGTERFRRSGSFLRSDFRRFLCGCSRDWFRRGFRGCG